MAAHTLHIDLPDAERPSVWPWLIALIAGAATLVLVVPKLQSIPHTLQENARLIIAEAGFENLTVRADGRDLTLNGTVPIQQSTADLLTALEQLDGVRVVRDQLTVVDPVAEAAAATQRFLQALSTIDTSSVAFQPGSASFTAASDQALDQIANLMRSHPDIRIRIEGHTDDTGPEAVNLRLSRERAQAVARYLSDRDIAADRLIAKGYGSTQPIDLSQTDEGRARNRRIEISYVN